MRVRNLFLHFLLTQTSWSKNNSSEEIVSTHRVPQIMALPRLMVGSSKGQSTRDMLLYRPALLQDLGMFPWESSSRRHRVCHCLGRQREQFVICGERGSTRTVRGYRTQSTCVADGVKIGANLSHASCGHLCHLPVLAGEWREGSCGRALTSISSSICVCRLLCSRGWSLWWL